MSKINWNLNKNHINLRYSYVNIKELRFVESNDKINNNENEHNNLKPSDF